MIAAVMVVVGLVAAGCGAGASSRSPDAPVVTVATGLWPLSQAASQIGQGNVKVVDVVPAGSDPRTYHLDAAQVATVRHADVVLEMAPGFQPSFDAAAGGSSHTVELVASAHADPYVWLNPYSMEAIGQTIYRAMRRRDPKAAHTFSNGVSNLEAQLGSLDDDYQSTLSACPDQTLVTVDDAFGVLHPRYPVVDEPIAPDGAISGLPSPATVAAEAKVIRATGTDEIYNESWVPESDIIGATVETRVKVGELDTLAGPPPGGWRHGSTYFSLMETNLSTISSALHCPNPDDD
jgi:ABC-type Zn uptake system ZnuABC Zn-binding protein ZnuA